MINTKLNFYSPRELKERSKRVESIFKIAKKITEYNERLYEINSPLIIKKIKVILIKIKIRREEKILNNKIKCFRKVFYADFIFEII